MTLQKEVFEAYRMRILEDPEGNRAGGLAMKEYIEGSPLNYKGVLDKTVYVPKVFDEETISRFRKIVQMSIGIFDSVIRAYRNDEAVRRLYPFSEELEKLILLPAPYEGMLPIARLDIFYNEDSGDFQFCEINTDGTAAMLRDLELRKALEFNPAHREVEKEYDLQHFELFDSWVRTFMELYESAKEHCDDPHVVMADFLENATYREFEEFARAFERAGISCEICDIRSLQYKDGRLFSEKGKKIDAIYRRAVTADIMAHYEEVTPFIKAVSDGAVFYAGAFETQLIHTKWLFYVLHHPDMRRLLKDEQKDFVDAHVPKTVEFSPEFISLQEVLDHKDSYILKPMDAYASKGIYASGREYDQQSWQDLCTKLYGTGMICQQYCTQYLTPNIDYAWGDGEWHPYINMPGLYAYNGQLAGILMRMACDEKIIVAHENERTAPVFVVNGRKRAS